MAQHSDSPKQQALNVLLRSKILSLGLRVRYEANIEIPDTEKDFSDLRAFLQHRFFRHDFAFSNSKLINFTLRKQNGKRIKSSEARIPAQDFFKTHSLALFSPLRKLPSLSNKIKINLLKVLNPLIFFRFEKIRVRWIWKGIV